jgi:TrpR-related protein YerC/YecD
MTGKIKFHELSDDEKRKFLGDFYSIISSLNTRDEVKCFFKDLLTISEIVMISRRIQIAKMLLKNWTYQVIKKKLKVGVNTIAQVEKWLNNGFGGYKKTIKAFTKKNKQKQIDDMKKSSENTHASLGELKKKYPGHFMLLDLFD